MYPYIYIYISNCNYTHTYMYIYIHIHLMHWLGAHGIAQWHEEPRMSNNGIVSPKNPQQPQSDHTIRCVNPFRAYDHKGSPSPQDRGEVWVGGAGGGMRHGDIM